MKRNLFILFLTLWSINIIAQEPDFNLNLRLYQGGLFEDAFNAFSKSAQYTNNVKSQYYLAECYMKGRGVEKDDKKAFQMYRRLAEKGLPVAQAKLAYCLYKGIGIGKDIAKANFWMDKALRYDNVDAYTLYVLGTCYEEGLGRRQDVHKAMELYTEALSRGVDDAYVHLALLLSSGGVIRKDLGEAIRIINEAISKIGSVDDYACKGHILMFNGRDSENIENWKAIQNTFPNYAVNSQDEYCVALRRISPIPESILIASVNQREQPEELQSTSTSPSSNTFTNNVINNITIKYEIVQNVISQPVQQDEPANRLSSQEIVQVQLVNTKSDVDENIPSTASSNENTFALIIANENYQEVAKVPNALNDGEVFAKYCIHAMGLPATNVTLVNDATFNNIKREIGKLTKITEAYKGTAKIVFYYAGHGIPDEATKDAFLLPVDGYGTDTSTGYSLKELYSTLGSMPTEQVVVLLDACFSGTQRGEGMLASARGVAIKAKPNKVDGKMVILSAAQGDETAYPYEEQGHGLFTYYLLKKLKESQGNVTLGDLASYIKDNVSKKSIVVNGKSQTPSVNPSASLGESWKNWTLK